MTLRLAEMPVPKGHDNLVVDLVDAAGNLIASTSFTAPPNANAQAPCFLSVRIEHQCGCSQELQTVALNNY